MRQRKQFKYIKINKDVSDRYVWVLSQPSDKLFCIDLSEFDNEEKEYLYIELERIDEMVKQEITELGLDSCYRQFKKDKIIAP